MFCTLNPKLLALKSLSIVCKTLSFCLVFHQKHLFNSFLAYHPAHSSCFFIGDKYEKKKQLKIKLFLSVWVIKKVCAENRNKL